MKYGDHINTFIILIQVYDISVHTIYAVQGRVGIVSPVRVSNPRTVGSLGSRAFDPRCALRQPMTCSTSGGCDLPRFQDLTFA